MNRHIDNKTVRSLGLAIFFLMLAGILLPGNGWSNQSGLELELYPTQESPKYYMNQAIGLIGVIKNNTQWPINTNKDFKQIELERFIIATDPLGVKHTANQELLASDMPPPSKWGEWETVYAEVLDTGWERSVAIDDLKILFPIMTTLPGEYQLQIVVPFSRFPYTVMTETGLMGVLDNRVWDGNVQSTTIRIMVLPQEGARLRIRVEDLSQPEFQPQEQVEVRIFLESSITSAGYSLEEAWSNLAILAKGKTDQGGWVTLPKGATCLPRPPVDDAYVAIAQYSGEYKDAVIAWGDDGWLAECSGQFERYIFFGEVLKEYSLFALNSIWLRNNARIESGDVGAQLDCDPCLVSDFDVALDGGAWLADSTTIEGNRVHVESPNAAWDVKCNYIDNPAGVRNEITTPLATPVWDPLPEFKTTVGRLKKDFSLDSQGDATLPVGSYRNVSIGSHAILRLLSGTYQIKDLTLSSHAKIICEGPVEILIDGTLESSSAKASYIGPSSGASISPKDVVLYVAGSPDAVLLGQGTIIRANIYAKNGLFSTGEGATLDGSVIARDISLGQKSVVTYNGVFFKGDAGVPENTPPVADFSYVTDNLTVTFTDTSYDLDGNISERQWDFGDNQAGSSLAVVEKIYDAPGTYEVILMVTDNEGASDSRTQYVTVDDGSGTGTGLVLTASPRTAGANSLVDLNWTGECNSEVEIYKNDSLSSIATVTNSGAYTDSVGKKVTNEDFSYYLLCVDNGLTSNTAVASF